MNSQQFTAQKPRLQSLLDTADRDDGIPCNKPFSEFTFEEVKRLKLRYPFVCSSKEEREGNYMMFQGRKYPLQ